MNSIIISKSARKLSKIVLLNFAILVLMLASAELLVRVYRHKSVILQSPKAFLASLLNFGSIDSHLNNSNELRHPYPYLMFKGKDNALDHNKEGFRFAIPTSDEGAINVAFFGGSTGYGGSPPIAEILSRSLSTINSKKVNFLNFSVVSSNHNQHVHSLLEQAKKHRIDLVLFYGGYNETLQTAYHDPRPGFPYNFRIRNQLQPELQVLYKHSALLQYLDKRLNLINRVLGIKDTPFTAEWNSSIVENYFATLSQAWRISDALVSGRCSNPFLAIYQPYKFSEGAPGSFKTYVHDNIRKTGRKLSNWIDVSSSLDLRPDVYTDPVHVNQAGNEAIASSILSNKKVSDIISSCR